MQKFLVLKKTDYLKQNLLSLKRQFTSEKGPKKFDSDKLKILKCTEIHPEIYVFVKAITNFQVKNKTDYNKKKTRKEKKKKIRKPKRNTNIFVVGNSKKKRNKSFQQNQK